MSKKLFVQAVLKIMCGVIITGFCLFLPAGTFDYPGAWLFMGILFVPMLIGGIIQWTYVFGWFCSCGT